MSVGSFDSLRSLKMTTALSISRKIKKNEGRHNEGKELRKEEAAVALGVIPLWTGTFSGRLGARISTAHRSFPKGPRNSPKKLGRCTRACVRLSKHVALASPMGSSSGIRDWRGSDVTVMVTEAMKRSRWSGPSG